jgi:glycerol-3-phosphate acyltransferase PlsY
VTLVALAALAGHNWSLFLRGRGGKGVATGAGTILGMMPLIVLALVGLFAVVLAGTGYVSLASLVAAVGFPVLTVATGRPLPYILYSITGAAIVVWAHRGNIRRLLRGQEPRLSLPWRREAKRPRRHGTREGSRG